jgi:hypothetical protein
MAGFIPDAKRDDWNTPQYILDAVREAFQDDIHLDPCSNANSIVGSKENYLLPYSDGLRDSWDFPTIYVNPSYGRSIGRWIKRADDAAKLHGSQIAMLIPCTPETKPWKEIIWTSTTGICMLNRRVKFLGALQGIPKPLAVPYWAGARGSYEQFERAFKKLGVCIPTKYCTASFKEIA